MAKLVKKTPIKKNAPKVNEAIEEVIEVKAPVVKNVIVVEHNFKTKIMEQVDRLIESNHKLFERKTIERNELELILNSVFKS
jgi:mevalonate kinase